MLKRITQSGILIALFFCATMLKAEPVGYETLSPAQPTRNPEKIEVIEFFWYGCPHCYSLEPLMGEWLKNLPKNVDFIRQPAVFSELWGKHAKAYFTAEALGVVDKVHGDLFDAVQNKKQKLETEDELAAFFVAHGVNKTEFHDTYNSFLIDAKMRQAATTAGRYGVTGVPAVIINGKYKTNGPLAGSHEKMIEVINQLIQQESQAK
ncbi:MAG: thiol:disulfide interchange protein DsbA/DsbL [Methylobacter sp.]|nr:thiol:disulfide interchange protein DsbA/DsbL [Methylobacter sp.]MDP2429361.1 thiol:disulfide interchange protein DsbA/DsbL [Methylobacter sp.]MDP3053786.1 thiol:disulfide interchange protein DsbA/DsbL [Methylobacter sp.]MDP3362769.1 thiol:disulfide interchange protein DsbA/DsbL [Methylobacter sp.]MDZ4218777.1 thiol:disulfide interchange protein DsbA/DsbL [Methylobacter sp.]